MVISSRRMPTGVSHPFLDDHRKRQVHAADTRLLYENATTGIVVTLVIASVLAYAQWDWSAVHRVGVAHLHAAGVGREIRGRAPVLARVGERHRERSMERGVRGRRRAGGRRLGCRRHRAVPISPAVGRDPAGIRRGRSHARWCVDSWRRGRRRFSPSCSRPVFSLPSAWPVEGDEDHLMMAFLGRVFTVATVVTTWRFHLAIESSFRLRFDNRDLIESLQTAKNEAEALNRELELRVRDRTAKLEEADQRKDEFLAMLAHELRNPLAPIRFALETLKVDAPRGIAARARDVIERQVGQLVRLVDDLLDVSRITANKIQLRREPLDLAPLMATAVESITPLAAAAGHTVDVQLPSAPIRVDGDGARLVQVFANVLNNAVKFTPPGGHIWFTADQQSTRLSCASAIRGWASPPTSSRGCSTCSIRRSRFSNDPPAAWVSG